ncbi:MAG: NAD(P)-binding domain-containing protein [candidate division Zixibacteria bacterium]|nr:NAD(P)-binding domain-containing protein [candidate division Zixibacteria bacterium]
MRKFVVIGLGNFGFYLARSLFEEGKDVIGVDRDKERVQRLREFCSYAVVGDATDKSVLESIGIEREHLVVVSLGGNISASVLVTLYLKDLKVENIYVKIISEDHGRALERIGATEVIFPERDLAKKLAKTLLSPNLIDYIPLTEEYNIFEIAPPKEFIGKTLGEIRLRRKYNINILAVRGVVPEKITMNPDGTFMIKDSDILLALGKPDDIEKIRG